jgi:hypothetical protein
MSVTLRRLAPTLAALALAIALPAQAHETGLPHLLHEFGPWVAIGTAAAALLAAGAVLVRVLRAESQD